MTPRARPTLHLLALLLLVISLPPSARADNPLLGESGRPNLLFWTTGAVTLALDQPLYDLAHRLDSPATHRAAVAFNHAGDGRVQLGAFALLALAGGQSNRRIARQGLHGLVAGGLVVNALKYTTRKSRPWEERGPRYGTPPKRAARAQDQAAREEETAPLAEPGGHSDGNKAFPSGHTMAAFSLATVWANERPRDRELAYAVATLAGLSRIYLKQHWPSDVFFGAALGIAAGNAAGREVPFGLMFRIR